MSRHRGSVPTAMILAAMAYIALPARGTAQGVCSAPHSTGGISTGSGVAVLPPGAGWLQLTGLRWVSSEFFGTDGAVRPLLAGGTVTTHSLYATLSVGVLTGVDVLAQAPVHDLTFEDQTGRRERAGIGDVRAALRIGGAAFGLPELPVVVRGGVKLPGSRFPVDATVIPLTEGQRDWELSIAYGLGLIQPSPLAPPTLAAAAWLGYRWREPNEDADRKPGDEVFGHLEIRGLLDPFTWTAGVDAVFGRPPIQQGFELPGARRELWQLTGSAALPAGPGRVSASLQLPVAGRNLPTGPSLSIGYVVEWSAP